MKTVIIYASVHRGIFNQYLRVGGIAKRHPNEKDLEAAVNFMTELQS